MPDFARSEDAAVQRQIDRLMALGPGTDVLGLERITQLLQRIGDPHRRLPPVLHVAGTNGKGSTCAYLRAATEAAGMRAHVYSSPHLVRFNERIRIAGRLIDDHRLASLLAGVLDAGGDIGASFFEVTTAAAFLAFAETPADVCIIEVGLGGRLDATNVLADPAATAIAQLGIDHQAFLGDTIAAIAFEKAGIAKSGRPLVMLDAPAEAVAVIDAHAHQVGAPVYRAGVDWHFRAEGSQLIYHDRHGDLSTPLPALAGVHQHANLALALATLRHQDRIDVPVEALRSAASGARWPARMQRLSAGPLTDRLAPGTPVWLDGGHNANAAEALAAAIRAAANGQPIAIVIGMLANKDAETMMARLAPLADQLIAVPIEGHAAHAPEVLARLARVQGIPAIGTAEDVAAALDHIGARRGTRTAPVLICGSLYLAGRVLAANNELPE